LNGKVERFFGTLKPWQRLTLFCWSHASIQKRLAAFRDSYNTERPMWLHAGRTPKEVYRGLPPLTAESLREDDPLKPAISVRRQQYRSDHNLPKLVIEIVRTVKRAA
jgi:hypothetical protein